MMMPVRYNALRKSRCCTAALFLIIGLICLFPSLGAAAADDRFCFDKASELYAVPAELIEAISQWETQKNQRAFNWNRNGTYDITHMQINSSWYRKLGPARWDSLTDPCQATIVGTWILSQCIERHGYTWEAIGCYNAGSRRDRDASRKKYAWNIYKTLTKAGQR
jgi:soluble lytic murein transglycosylase-like protein